MSWRRNLHILAFSRIFILSIPVGRKIRPSPRLLQSFEVFRSLLLYLWCVHFVTHFAYRFNLEYGHVVGMCDYWF
eukprot:UN26149